MPQKNWVHLINDKEKKKTKQNFKIEQGAMGFAKICRNSPTRWEQASSDNLNPQQVSTMVS